MCKYCDDNEEIREDIDQSGMSDEEYFDKYFEDKTWIRITSPNKYNKGWSLIIDACGVGINYCPFCGRKLKKED